MSDTATIEKQEPAGPRSIKDIIADLTKPIPPRFLKKRKQGGAELTYIEWHTAVKFLDLFAPGWSFEVRAVQQIGDKCVVTVRLSIFAIEGVTWREATGQEDVDVKAYGDSSSNAEAMALKRAAAKFGLAIALYDKD